MAPAAARPVLAKHLSPHQTPTGLDGGYFMDGYHMERDQLPFPEVLQKVFDDERVPIHLLYRLSDLTADDFDLFNQQWAAASPGRRQLLARHMADITEENFVVDFSPMFQMMLTDSQVEVRSAALDGLWDCAHTRLVVPIIQVMQQDAAASVRTLAAATLGHIVLMAEWGQMDARYAAQAVEALLQQYENPLEEMAVRRAALESLGASGDSRVPALLENAYYAGDDLTQISALFAMGRSADSRWLAIVLEEMDNPYTEIRLEAARAAGNIGDSDAVERLIELLDDEDLEVRLAVVYSLGQIGSETAFEALTHLLEGDHEEELIEAVEAALEETDWLQGEFDFSMMQWDEEDGFDEDEAGI